MIRCTACNMKIKEIPIQFTINLEAKAAHSGTGKLEVLTRTINLVNTSIDNIEVVDLPCPYCKQYTLKEYYLCAECSVEVSSNDYCFYNGTHYCQEHYERYIQRTCGGCRYFKCIRHPEYGDDVGLVNREVPFGNRINLEL